MIKVAAIQMRSEIGAIEVNRLRACRYVREAASNGARLICLPELWVTGYGMDTELFRRLCETVDGPTISMFRNLAKDLNVVLIIPFPEREKNSSDPNHDSIYISAAIIDADGEICQVYRKSMLWGAEKNTFSAGLKNYVVHETAVGRVGILICYDIEFPEPARLLALKGADIIVVPSVWSFQAEPRWDIQLPARALDNSIYILGVNTVGQGACGKSKLVDPKGTILSEASRTEESILYGEMDVHKLNSVRKDIPYMRDYPSEFTPGGTSNSSDRIRGA